VGTSLIIYIGPEDHSTSAQPDSQDLYEVLGIDEEASATQIRKAYQKACRKFHPDMHPNDPTMVAKFQRIKFAYETLSDPHKRAFWDATGMQAPDAAKITSLAMDHVHGMYSSAMDACSSNEDPSFNIDMYDIVSDVKRVINLQIADLHNKRAKWASAEGKLKSLRLRLKRKRGSFEDTPMYVMLEQKIQHLKKLYTASGADLDVHVRALELASEYSCDIDDPMAAFFQSMRG
jgi:DnaJ-class molecular chaperone